MIDELLRWALLVVGATYLLTQTFIFAPYRRGMYRLSAFTGYFAYCPPCTSFWVGIAASQWWPWTVTHSWAHSGVSAVALGAIIGHYLSEDVVSREIRENT